MNNDFLFSIIVPVYNVEKYLSQCFDSITGIEEDLYEVILVNDGSTDDSEKICKDIVKKKRNFKLINQDNAGLSAARNTGMEIANGEYILFLDSDDFLNKNALVSIKKLLEEKNTEVFLGKAIKYYEGSETYELSNINYSKYDDNLSASELYLKINNDSAYWLAAWKFIVKREFIIENNLFFEEGLLHEDELWVPKIIVESKRLEVFDCEFYVYRIGRTGSIINNKNIKKAFDRVLISDRLYELSKEYKGSCQKVLRYRSAALIFGLLITIKEYEKEENYTLLKTQLNDRKSYLKVAKYRIVYYLCVIFSVDKVYNLFNRKFR